MPRIWSSHALVLTVRYYLKEMSHLRERSVQTTRQPGSCKSWARTRLGCFCFRLFDGLKCISIDEACLFALRSEIIMYSIYGMVHC